MRLRNLPTLLGCATGLAGCAVAPQPAAVPSSAAASPAPRAAAATTAVQRFTTTVIGTAILQDVREGVLRFDFTPDDGPTLEGLRMRAAEIDDLRDTLLEPGVRLRLRLIREFEPVGAAEPREVARRWEALRTR